MVQDRDGMHFDMKGISIMHYFLSLEVWQSLREVFLRQGNYAVEILKRFQMMDSKPLATPMIYNLKLSVDSDSDLSINVQTGDRFPHVSGKYQT
jgi:hypothetical protein